jgi:hypothetical protein
MSKVAKLRVELDDLRADVLEATKHELARATVYVLVDLVLCETHVGGQSDQILDRAIVKIEAEPEQALLPRLDETAFARRVSLEQHLALQNRADPRCRLPEEGECPPTVFWAGPRDEHSVRLLPSEHAHPVNRSALASAAVL